MISPNRRFRFDTRSVWVGKVREKGNSLPSTAHAKRLTTEAEWLLLSPFPVYFPLFSFFFYFFFNRRYIFPSTCGTRLNNSLRHVFDPSSQTPCVALPLSSKKKKKGHRALYIYLFISVYVNSFRPFTFCSY